MRRWFRRFECYGVSELAPLIIQGEDDGTVDWRHGRKVYNKRYPNGRWLMLPEGRHHLVNEADWLRNQMWSWLSAELEKMNLGK